MTVITNLVKLFFVAIGILAAIPFIFLFFIGVGLKDAFNILRSKRQSLNS